METRLINPNDCTCIQSRVLLDPATVAEYAEMMDKGVAFDPCKAVITQAGAILVYDGNHRVEAAKRNGSMIEVELLRGTEQDAAWQALAANTRHGLRRSADDVAKVVRDALRHPHALGKSDRELARHCGCDHKTVGKYRKSLEASGERPQITTRTVQRNGQEYQMTIPEPTVKEKRLNCPECNGQGTVLMKFWAGDNNKWQYDIVCLDCGERWDTQDALSADCREAERQKLQAAHEKHGLIPERTETVCSLCGTKIYGEPAEYQGAPYHPACHERVEHPDDWLFETDDAVKQAQAMLKASVPQAVRSYAIQQIEGMGIRAVKLLGWPAMPDAQYQNIHSGRIAPLSEFLIHDTRSGEKNRIPELLEHWKPAPDKHGLINETDDAPAAEPGSLSIEECDFCGETFPPEKVYASAGNLPNCFHLCKSCASKALHALLDPSDPEIIAESQQIEREIMQPTGALPEPTFQEGSSPSGLSTVEFREYNIENESKFGTEEWWFTRSEMTAWDHFQAYQYYRKKSGEEQSHIYKLDAEIRALKLDVQQLTKVRDLAIESYEKLRDKVESA